MPRWEYLTVTSLDHVVGFDDPATGVLKMNSGLWDPEVNWDELKAPREGLVWARTVRSHKHKHRTLLSEEIADLGDDGWELMGVSPPLPRDESLLPQVNPVTAFELYFKRPLPGD
jgi:hypothetical protein